MSFDFPSSSCGVSALSKCLAPSVFRITNMCEVVGPWRELGGRRGPVSGCERRKPARIVRVTLSGLSTFHGEPAFEVFPLLNFLHL